MSEQPEALRLAGALENLEATGWGGDCFALTESSEKQAEAAAAELRRLHALCVEQIKLIEQVNYLCADTVRTNSKDTRDWLEDVAFISSITAVHLDKWKESK